MDFAAFDVRKYPVVEVVDGYSGWAPTYEDTVLDLMDIRLLARLETVQWDRTASAIDLACGTGRIGQWMQTRGVSRIDGIDATAAMLERARDKNVYASLALRDVADTAVENGSYDLATMVLADEHLADLAPMYREVARITSGAAAFVLAGYHPHFMLNGIPTHYNREPGQPVTIQTYLHLFSHHFAAARAAGWQLDEYLEGLIDADWVARKPKWEAWLHHPVSFACVWRKARRASD